MDKNILCKLIAVKGMIVSKAAIKVLDEIIHDELNRDSEQS